MRRGTIPAFAGTGPRPTFREGCVMKILRKLFLCLPLCSLLSCGSNNNEQFCQAGAREGYPDATFGFAEGKVIADLEFVRPDNSSFALSEVHQGENNRLLLLSTAAELDGRAPTGSVPPPSIRSLHPRSNRQTTPRECRSGVSRRRGRGRDRGRDSGGRLIYWRMEIAVGPGVDLIGRDVRLKGMKSTRGFRKLIELKIVTRVSCLFFPDGIHSILPK